MINFISKKIDLIENRSILYRFISKIAIVDSILIVEIQIDNIRWSNSDFRFDSTTLIQFGDPNRISLLTSRPKYQIFNYNAHPLLPRTIFPVVTNFSPWMLKLSWTWFLNLWKDHQRKGRLWITFIETNFGKAVCVVSLGN